MIRQVLLSAFVASLFMSSVAFAQQASGPDVGTVVDEFSLSDQHGTSHALSDLVADGPIALVVFRSADW